MTGADNLARSASLIFSWLRSAAGAATFVSRTALVPASLSGEGQHRPAHDIGLWLGVVGPRAAGWSVSAPYVPPDRLPELHGIITAAARDAGRDPAAITRLYNVMGLITPEDRDEFHGPAERWADTLTALHTESQMNAFVFWPSGDRERQSRLFAEQVVPAVRESLARLDRAG